MAGEATEIETPLYTMLEPWDIAIFARVAPSTFTRLRHEPRRAPFR